MSAGKDLERDLQKILKETRGIQSHRFLDAHAARKYVNTQPADFVVWAGGTSILVECKESDVEPGLNKSAFHNDSARAQLGKMKLIEGTGNRALFLFRNPSLGVVQTIPASSIDLDKRAAEWPYRVDYRSLQQAVKAMLHYLS